LELIVKVDLKRKKDPVAHVAKLLRDVTPSFTTEEVFPGLREGASAGLVTVRLSCARGSRAHLESLEALRGDAAVAYVEEPKSRRPL
jgi:hypothetical protein